jgi:iron complex transport system permease protein
MDHKKLIPLVIIIGASRLLACDLVAQIPFSNYSQPINAVTSLVGAPLVIWLIVKKRYLRF